MICQKRHHLCLLLLICLKSHKIFCSFASFGASVRFKTGQCHTFFKACSKDMSTRFDVSVHKVQSTVFETPSRTHVFIGKKSVCDYVRNPSRMQVPNYLCLSKMTLVSKKNLDNCPPI